MIGRLHLSAVALALLGTGGLCASSALAVCNSVPFRASFSGNASITGPTTTAFAGTGYATLMGRIANDGHVQITGSDSSCPGGVANINVETLTAANGDTLTVTSQDVACLTGPGRYHGSGHWTVTAGTGRFSATTGQGTFDGSSDFNAGVFTTTLTGTLVLNARS